MALLIDVTGEGPPDFVVDDLRCFGCEVLRFGRLLTQGSAPAGEGWAAAGLRSCAEALGLADESRAVWTIVEVSVAALDSVLEEGDRLLPSDDFVFECFDLRSHDLLRL